MQPILVRNLETPDTAWGARRILETKPADVYFYGHLGSYERTVRDLLRSGVQIWRYATALHAHFAAAGWIPQSFERFMFDLATEHNFWLRDRTGALVRFRWYGEGPLYNWCGVPDRAYREIGSFLNRSPGVRRHLYFDLVFPRVRQWMFLDRKLRIRDLAGYGHLQWLQGTQKLLRTAGWPEKRVVRVNGEWNLDRHKLLAMYENADSGHNARHLTGTLRRWRSHPGTTLSINGRPQDLHARRVLEFWLEHGGYLWAENEATALHAWELLSESREIGPKKWPRQSYLPRTTEMRLKSARQVGMVRAHDAGNRRGTK